MKSGLLAIFAVSIMASIWIWPDSVVRGAIISEESSQPSPMAHESRPAVSIREEESSPNLRFTNNNGASENPRVATDGSFVYMVWQDNSGGNYDIYWSKFTFTGRGVVDPINISGSGGNSVNADIELDEHGNSYIVWQEGTPWGGISFVRLSTDGQALAATSFGEPLCLNPCIGTTPEGISYVAFEQRLPAIHYLKLKKVLQDGSINCSHIYSDWDIIDTEKHPDITVDDSGTPLLIWRDSKQDFTQRIIYSVVNSNCTPGTAWELCSQQSGIDQPALKMIAVLGGWILYEQNGNIRVVAGTANCIGCNISSGFAPSVDHNGSRGFAAWHRSAEGKNHIFMTRFDGCPTDWGDIRVDDGSGDAINSSIAVRKDGSDTWLTAWQDNRDGNWEIYISSPLIGSPLASIAPLPPSLDFHMVESLDPPLSQTLQIENAGSGILVWHIDGSEPWLNLSSYDGNSNSTDIQVSVDATGLQPGSYSATIQITSPNSNNSPQNVSVNFVIEEYDIVPIVLVHGWRGDPLDWSDGQGNDDMISRLKNDGHDYVWPVTLEKCGHPREANFRDDQYRVRPQVMYSGNASVLGNFITAQKNSLPDAIKPRVSKIDIIAHSMGGLVSRRYMNIRSGDDWTPLPVRKLVMLATPNLGSNWGSQPASYIMSQVSCGLFPGVAWDELGTGPMIQFNEEFPSTVPNETEYFVFWGHKNCPGVNFPCGAGGFAGLAVHCPNDGAVNKNSAIGYNCPDEGACTTAYPNNWPQNLCHGEFPNDENFYYQYVKRALDGTLLSGPSARDFFDTEDSDAQICYETAGTLMPQVASGGSFNSEGNSTLTVVVFSADSSTVFELFSPNGTKFDSTSTTLDSTIVYAADHSSGQAIRIVNAEAGMWQWVLQTEGSMISPTPFALFAICDDSVTVSRSQNTASPKLGEVLNLKVTVADNGLAATELAVFATPIWNGADTSAHVQLLDDGLHGDGSVNDGVYGLLFSDPKVGLVKFNTIVTGMTSAGTISRIVTFDAYFDHSLFYLCGDCNQNDQVDISDVVYLINFIFAGGPAPDPLAVGDVSCSAQVDISDAVYLINYIFAGGAAPCEACK